MGKQEVSWREQPLGYYCSAGRSISGGRKGRRRRNSDCVRVLDMESCVEEHSIDSSTESHSTEIAKLTQENKHLSAQVRGLEEKVNFLNKWRTEDPTESGTAEIRIVASDGMVCKAHRLIVEGRSDVLHQMLTPGNENYLGDRPIYMDISAASVRQFLTFLYNAEVSLEDLKAHSMELLWAAQKYKIPSLRILCEEFNTLYLGQLNLSNAIRGFEMASTDMEWKYIEETALQSIYGIKDLSSSVEFIDLKERDMDVAFKLLQQLYERNLA